MTVRIISDTSVRQGFTCEVTTRQSAYIINCRVQRYTVVRHVWDNGTVQVVGYRGWEHETAYPEFVEAHRFSRTTEDNSEV